MDHRYHKTENRKAAKRILCALLCLAMVFVFAVENAAVSYAADFNIDGSAFKNNEKSAQTVYYWHEGLPPADAVDGTKYPVLITWDDKYYLSVDSAFSQNLLNRRNFQIHTGITGLRAQASALGTMGKYQDLGLTDKFITGYSFKQEASQNIMLKGQEGYTSIKDWILGSASYLNYGVASINSFARLNARYGMSSKGMLSNNSVYQEYLSIKKVSGDDSTMASLLKNGFAITTDISNLPCLVCAETSPVKNVSNAVTGSTALTKTSQSRWGIWIPQQSGTIFSGQNNWLVGLQHYNVAVSEMESYANMSAYSLRYATNILYDFYLGVVSGSNAASTEVYTKETYNIGYSPRDFVDPQKYVSAPKYSGSQYDANPIGINKRTWIFEEQSDGTYTIGTWCGLASQIIDKEYDSVSQLCASCSYDGNYDTYMNLMCYPMWAWEQEDLGTMQHMGLYHDGSALVSSGADKNASISAANSKFRLFWGEPITLNFYKSDFTVQSGQVTNLDGPAFLGEDAVYRVEDGGVLVVTDMLINNGTIIVKKGGTLIIEENTDAYGNTRSGTLLSQIEGGNGGRISCEGTIIVMPSCKCFGGGKYGIQLGDGAYVVNYGTIGSENFTCYHDYTIENRSTESYVFAGYGVTGSGFLLTNYNITGRTYPCQGNRESTYTVSMAKNAVYGKGAANLVANPKLPSGSTTKEPTSGSVVYVVSKTIKYKFTTDQFYDFTFPNYKGEDGKDYKYVWVNKGYSVDMYYNGVVILHTTTNAGMYLVPVDITMSATDEVRIYRGGRSEQWVPPYTLGTRIYSGSFGDWVPPENLTVYYPDPNN